MRIAFIGQKGLPATGKEIEKQVENLALNLVGMGHKIFAYTWGEYIDKNIREYKGIKILHSSGPFSATFHSLFQKYDIIHYQDSFPALLSFIPKMAKKKTSVITTIYSKNNQREGFRNKIKALAEKAACSFSDKLIVTDKNLRSYIFHQYGKKSACIPEGTKVKYNFSTGTLERWGLKEKRYFIAFGDCVSSEEMLNLIGAFLNLESTNKLPNNFKLVVIGGKFRPYPAKNIIFTGNQNRAALEQLIFNAYFLVNPSESGKIPALFFEAMGYGIAPLASDTSKNIEAIGKCGWTFRSNSRKDLEEKIAYLINRPGEVKKMGKMAREKIRKDLSWDQSTRKVLKIYESSREAHQEKIPQKLSIESKFYVR